MTADGTVSRSSRPPARSTTSAVMTFVMLAIGRSVLRSRLHRTVPLSAFAIAAAPAVTPDGPAEAAEATDVVPANAATATETTSATLTRRDMAPRLCALAPGDDGSLREQGDRGSRRQLTLAAEHPDQDRLAILALFRLDPDHGVVPVIPVRQDPAPDVAVVRAEFDLLRPHQDGDMSRGREPRFVMNQREKSEYCLHAARDVLTGQQVRVPDERGQVRVGGPRVQVFRGGVLGDRAIAEYRDAIGDRQRL